MSNPGLHRLNSPYYRVFNSRTGKRDVQSELRQFKDILVSDSSGRIYLTLNLDSSRKVAAMAEKGERNAKKFIDLTDKITSPKSRIIISVTTALFLMCSFITPFLSGVSFAVMLAVDSSFLSIAVNEFRKLRRLTIDRVDILHKLASMLEKQVPQIEKASLGAEEIVSN